MNWLSRHGLKLTVRGERVVTALTGALIIGGIVIAGFIEGGMLP